MDRHRCHIAPKGWDPADPNPFSPDGAYGPGWSCFVLLDRPGTTFYTGLAGNSLFGIRLEHDVPGVSVRLADFCRYETAHGRRVILGAPEDIDMAAFVERADRSTPPAQVIRPSDEAILVHSTSLSSWDSISRCGELRSLARLRREGHTLPAVGFHQLGEPADYADHVMLGTIDSFAAEHVVSSQQKGSIVTEEHTPYEPGVRIYLDAHTIIRSGLGVRDGAHVLKVEDHLPLAGYMIAHIGITDLPTSPAGWTPRTFLNAANARFQSLH